jgi:hypothetical protein
LSNLVENGQKMVTNGEEVVANWSKMVVDVYLKLVENGQNC